MKKILKSFDDEIHNSQDCFREILKAMSEPGTKVKLNYIKGFGKAAAASTQILLTLSDNMTSIWFSEYFKKDTDLTNNISFYTNSKIVNNSKYSTFALIDGSEEQYFEGTLPFSVGSLEYPDKNTTVIVEVSSFSHGESYFLKGPGIQSTKPLTISGIPKSLIYYLINRKNEDIFPMGIDFIFVCDEEVIAIPRTTLMERKTCM